MRKRLRDLGISIGRYEPGPLNAITDVAGVRVGHSTISRNDPAGIHTVRTGVTAILPNEGNIFMERVVGGAFVLNGAGEMSGLVQVLEWGLIETPIMLTNTLAVGVAGQGVVHHMVDRYPGIGVEQDVIIPLVGECDDSFLNDISGHHVGVEHVLEALANASAGPVDEGCVGGGTGMVSFDLKGGIGTSSRQRLVGRMTDFRLGVLVQSNVGRLEDLRVDGAPIGEALAPEMTALTRRENLYGSIIAIIATDAPLNTHQLGRLCKRVALGIGRVGSYAAHGSGEIIVGFSTANTVPRESADRYTIESLSDRCMDPLYQAAIECTEEAMLNALCMAETTLGVRGRISPELPLDRLVELYRHYRPAPPTAP